MSRENIRHALGEFGLTEKESDVYILLAREGVLKGLDISKRLRMHKAQVYTILKNLQSKGAVETTLEAPARFTAVPFANLLDLFIRTKKEQASSMEKQRDTLFSSWESVKLGGPTSPIEKFLAVRGTNNVNLTISGMMEQANKELRMIMTPLDVIRAERLDYIETLSRLKKDSAFRCRILTHISKENLNIVKNSAKPRSTRHVAIEWRHIGSESATLPRIIMKDGEEVFILQSEETTVPPRWDNGLWTNSKLITHVTSRLFEELWIKSANAKERIAQIDVGKSLGKSVTINDASSAHKLYIDTLAQTSNEIITITPSINSFTHLGNHSMQSLSIKGVNVRAMFPIDAANIDHAIALSKYCKVRDPSVNYLAVTLVDGKHVFRFGTKVPDAESTDPLKYFQDMYYSNEKEQVEKMAEMLEGLWQRSVEILDIKSKLTRKG